MTAEKKKKVKRGPTGPTGPTGPAAGGSLGNFNTAVGESALENNTTGEVNTAVGAQALQNNTTGDANTAVGFAALAANTAVGFAALAANTAGVSNTALGTDALLQNTSGANNTALGDFALGGTNFSNTTGLGANSAVTANHQVQLGDSATTTFAFGPVQNRSDARDKSDVRGTVLGLEFITALRPVDYRWDPRDDYRPAPLEPPDAAATGTERAAYQAKLAAWREASRLGTLRHDGSQARTRYHHGLIAQEVAAVIERTGVDFGGYQDHAAKGGDDVLSLGYAEFIAPLIKAVQELAARNGELESENAQTRVRLAAVEAALATSGRKEAS